jgi:hypothetical protein
VCNQLISLFYLRFTANGSKKKWKILSLFPQFLSLIAGSPNYSINVRKILYGVRSILDKIINSKLRQLIEKKYAPKVQFLRKHKRSADLHCLNDFQLNVKFEDHCAESIGLFGEPFEMLQRLPDEFMCLGSAWAQAKIIKYCFPDDLLPKEIIGVTNNSGHTFKIQFSAPHYFPDLLAKKLVLRIV